MTLKRPELWCLVFGLGAGFAVGRVGHFQTAAEAPLRVTAAEAPRMELAAAPQRPLVTRPALRSETGSSALLTRELFSPLVPGVDRGDRSEVTVEGHQDAAEAVAPPPVPEALSAPTNLASEDTPSLVLVGITVASGKAQALIEERESGLARSVGAGEVAFGTKVVRIGAGEVVLSRNGQAETLQLGEGKIVPKVELLSDGFHLGLSDPLNASLKELPSPVLSTLARVMPRAGILRRVRSYTDNGQRVHRVEKLVDGLEHELRVNDNGEVLQFEASLRAADVPATVVDAANRAVPGYQVNLEDTPKLLDRNGQRYYVIEVRQEGGRAEIDLRIGADGRLLGQG